jgi:two-component system KDP operon response regulator KdpE
MKLLVIDDDEAIRDALSVSLSFQCQDCQVVTAADGGSGLQAFYQANPDAVLLDLNLPDITGFEVLGRIRETSSVPVLMLTAKDGETDVVRALEMGADHYVTKPFRSQELMARIKAALRRVEPPAALAPAQEFRTEGLTIHFPTQRVEVNGRPVLLTGTEYRLLYHLVRNAGRIMSHRSLLQKAWGSEGYGTDIVRVYVSRLRSKIEQDPSNPRFVLTKPGAGYIFVAKPGEGSESEGGADERKHRALRPPAGPGRARAIPLSAA